jgi:hypothetical protein
MHQMEISNLPFAATLRSQWLNRKSGILVPILLIPTTIILINSGAISQSVSLSLGSIAQTFMPAFRLNGFAEFAQAAKYLFSEDQSSQSNQTDQTDQTSSPLIRPSGLVGAAVDPAFGQANEVGILADYGYDLARDISRLITLLSFIFMFAIRVWQIKRSKVKCLHPVRRAICSLALVGGVPASIHVIGTFVINNFGGIGGCGL